MRSSAPARLQLAATALATRARPCREPVVVAPAAANVAGAAVALRGTLTVSRSKDRHRGLDLVLQCTAVEAGGRERDAGTTAYRMGVSSN